MLVTIYQILFKLNWLNFNLTFYGIIMNDDYQNLFVRVSKEIATKNQEKFVNSLGYQLYNVNLKELYLEPEEKHLNKLYGYISEKTFDFMLRLLNPKAIELDLAQEQDVFVAKCKQLNIPVYKAVYNNDYSFSHYDEI
tara:strand:+ start:35 stop:448 length:414 start_codon:yes stop_codon:yes gene_type:complete